MVGNAGKLWILGKRMDIEFTTLSIVVDVEGKIQVIFIPRLELRTFYEILASLTGTVSG